MRLVTVFTGLCLTAYAQSSGQGVLALPMDVQLFTAPPSTPATYLNLTVDASANDGDFIDVVSPSPQVQMSLILPNGTEVTAGNASTFGFSVLQQTNGSGTAVASGVFTPFDAFGTHTTFILPAGSPGGVYQVKANSSMVATSTSVSSTYFSMSGVKAGIAKDKLVYNPGGTVTLTAFIFSGSTQVTGAAVSATIVPPVSLNTEATISNYQVVNQTANGGFTQYTYQASLTNTSNGTFTTAIAKLVNVPSTITLIDTGALGFANVPASASTTSVNTFSVQVATGQTFDPTTLSWDINATGVPTMLALPDSGGGNYTGVYTPSVPGMYQVLVNITGAFAGGLCPHSFYDIPGSKSGRNPQRDHRYSGSQCCRNTRPFGSFRAIERSDCRQLLFQRHAVGKQWKDDYRDRQSFLIDGFWPYRCQLAGTTGPRAWCEWTVRENSSCGFATSGFRESR